MASITHSDEEPDEDEPFRNPNFESAIVESLESNTGGATSESPYAFTNNPAVFFTWCRDVKIQSFPPPDTASGSSDSELCGAFVEIEAQCADLRLILPRTLASTLHTGRYEIEREIDRDLEALLMLAVVSHEFHPPEEFDNDKDENEEDGDEDEDRFGIARDWVILRRIIHGFRVSSETNANDARSARLDGDEFIRSIFHFFPRVSDDAKVVDLFEVELALHHSNEGPSTSTADFCVFMEPNVNTPVGAGLLRSLARIGDLNQEAFVTREVNRKSTLRCIMFCAEAPKATGGTCSEEADAAENRLICDLSSAQFQRRALGLPNRALFGCVYSGSRFELFASEWDSKNDEVCFWPQKTYDLTNVKSFIECYSTLCLIRDSFMEAFPRDVAAIDKTKLATSLEAYRWRTARGTDIHAARLGSTRATTQTLVSIRALEDLSKDLNRDLQEARDRVEVWRRAET